MKLTFTGQRRIVYFHDHPVTPGRAGRGRPGAPIQWASATVAYGRVRNLGLNGNFKIKFEYEESELRNWLQKYIEEDPAKGLELVSEMQAKAIIQLSASSGETAAPD